MERDAKEREEEQRKRERERGRGGGIGLLFWGKPRWNTHYGDKSKMQAIYKALHDNMTGRD